MTVDPPGNRPLHELGNLLAVIAGQAEYLLHEEPATAAERAEVLARIRDAALRGRDTLRELYARVPPRPAEPERTGPAPAAGVMRLLLIDDDPAVRNAMAALLRQAGHRVETASDAASALDACERERFDCVLTDHTMPGLSGLDLSPLLKARQPDLFVILLTGAGAPIDERPYRAAGVDRLLLKPARREEILAAVAAARRLALPL